MTQRICHLFNKCVTVSQLLLGLRSSVVSSAQHWHGKPEAPHGFKSHLRLDFTSPVTFRTIHEKPWAFPRNMLHACPIPLDFWGKNISKEGEY